MASTLKLDRRAAAGEHVALEVRRNVQGEGIAPGIHAAIHLAQVDALRRTEIGLLKGLDQPLGELRLVFVDHGDGGVVQALRHAGGGGVDAHAEGPEDQQHQRQVMLQAAQLLDAEVEDIGQAFHQTSCLRSRLALISVSSGMVSARAAK